MDGSGCVPSPTWCRSPLPSSGFTTSFHDRVAAAPGQCTLATDSHKLAVQMDHGGSPVRSADWCRDSQTFQWLLPLCGGTIVKDGPPMLYRVLTPAGTIFHLTAASLDLASRACDGNIPLKIVCKHLTHVYKLLRASLPLSTYIQHW